VSVNKRQVPEILRTNTLARSRLFHIEQLDLRFSNGTEVQYERLNSGSHGAVLVVPMLDDNTVVMIREYAAGVGRYELALPKGRIEPGEDKLDAANREIKEEIGYGAKQLEHLQSVSIAPGYLSHVTQIILARDLYEHHEDGDEPEEIEVVPWRMDRLSDLMAQEDFTEARSIAALFLAKEFLQK